MPSDSRDTHQEVTDAEAQTRGGEDEVAWHSTMVEVDDQQRSECSERRQGSELRADHEWLVEAANVSNERYSVKENYKNRKRPQTVIIEC